ncbi:MAG: DUF4065 domain-containing protein [Clostridia bacterium]|nr:DUF4065 domain-containing protein [Clostridia bacterium]
MEENTNNIVQDAYYLISLFEKEGKNPTQLHIQKLMYLFEAYYMNVENVDKLYDCNYQAWNFGPVATPLYKELKVYGKNPIALTEEEREWAEEIPDKKKKLMKNLYEVFKNFTAMQLVNFTHAEGSPWNNAWNEKTYSEISKKDIKQWFSKYVKKS